MQQAVMQNPIPSLGSLERNSTTGLGAASINSISLLAVYSAVLKAPGKRCRTATPAPLKNRRISHTQAHFAVGCSGFFSTRRRFVCSNEMLPGIAWSQGIVWSGCERKRGEACKASQPHTFEV